MAREPKARQLHERMLSTSTTSFSDCYLIKRNSQTDRCHVVASPWRCFLSLLLSLLFSLSRFSLQNTTLGVSVTPTERDILIRWRFISNADDVGEWYNDADIRKFVVVEDFDDVTEVGCSLEMKVSNENCENNCMEWREKCKVWREEFFRKVESVIYLQLVEIELKGMKVSLNCCTCYLCGWKKAAILVKHTALECLWDLHDKYVVHISIFLIGKWCKIGVLVTGVGVHRL